MCHGGGDEVVCKRWAGLDDDGDPPPPEPSVAFRTPCVFVLFGLYLYPGLATSCCCLASLARSNQSSRSAASRFFHMTDISGGEYMIPSGLFDLLIAALKISNVSPTATNSRRHEPTGKGSRRSVVEGYDWPEIDLLPLHAETVNDCGLT